MVEPAVEIYGVRDVKNALRKVSSEFPKQLRAELKSEVAEPVAADIRAGLPVGPGRGGRHWYQEVRAGATQVMAYVQWGRKLPYPGWVEFGGTIRQPNRGVVIQRTRAPDGRYVYPKIERYRNTAERAAITALTTVARRAGLDVTTEGAS